jgi:hypothetical protein
MLTRKELGQLKRDAILEKIEYLELDEVLLADGHDHAIIGLVELGCEQRVTVKDKGGTQALSREHVVVAYSTKAILEGLMDDSDMSAEEAMEYFEFNIKGAWLGSATPVYVQDEQDLFMDDV